MHSHGNRREFLKRAACTIASQLPDDRAEALVVLGYAEEIIINLGGWGRVGKAPVALRAVRLATLLPVEPDR